MKKECFAVRQLRLSGEENVHVQDMTLQLYTHDCYSILCDDLGTRELLTDFFLGKAVIEGGSCRIEGQQLRPQACARRLQRSAAVISPKDKLIRTWTVSENIGMFSDAKKWQYKRHFLHKTEELAGLFGLELMYKKPVEMLTPKERVLVELLKAYAEKRKIIVFAGLSTLLPRKEMEELHNIVRKMCGMEQPVSFVLIENPGDMALSWSLRAQIIRRHIDYGCFNTEFLDRQKLYAFYAERDMEYRTEWPEDMVKETEGKEAFSFSHVSTLTLQNISFRTFAGHFFKIFCQDTESMEGIYRAVSGEDDLLTGQICVKEEPVRVHSLQNMRKNNICYCKAKAYDSMLFPEMTARDNILIELSKKIRNPYMQRKYQKSVDGFILQTLGPGKASCKVEELSVIERQKLAFLKIYMMAPKVLLCEQPFFDADTQMKEVTIDVLRKLAARGIAVIVLTIQLDIMDWFGGEELYISGGKTVDKEEMYQLL